MTLKLTPTQSVGPYYTLGMIHENINILVKPETEGERITLEGYVYDGDGDPLALVLLEIWQANAAGRYNHPLDDRPLPLDPSFIGFGRDSTDAHGHYHFETIKPGPVPSEGDSMQAAHITMLVHASGVAYPLLTRVYFDDDPATESDHLLQRVPAERRRTMIATRSEGENGATYRFDIVVKGELEDLVLTGKLESEAESEAASGAGKAETVFLAVR